MAVSEERDVTNNGSGAVLGGGAHYMGNLRKQKIGGAAPAKVIFFQIERGKITRRTLLAPERDVTRARSAAVLRGGVIRPS